MHFGFVVNIILFKYLQSSDYTKTNYPQYEKYFKHGLNISIILMVFFFSIHYIRDLTVWISNLTNLALAYFAHKRPELFPIREYVKAFLPLLLVTIVQDILGLFGWHWIANSTPIFQTASALTFFWMIAMWIITRRQHNALEKQKEVAKRKEARIAEAEQTNLLLEEQVAARTAEITAQKEELQLALDDLKSTQTQLIHAEKMASLGELTAGIAHEIQNPLNFVNNFSEVSSELLDEVREEIENGNKNDALDILTDLQGNLRKIHQHGGRASSIVKGMLDHSRASSDEKVPTDLNALCDEYLRLSYHGIRAKDKSFNSAFETDFSSDLPEIKVVSQDIGRVILNVLNNAFYAVHSKAISKKVKAESSYKPLVKISTHKTSKYVNVVVEDNGIGMSSETVDKIFQPFFTTKPTGKGTGLGMSISYEIITKGHRGNIKVESEFGKGSKFTILLPLK